MDAILLSIAFGILGYFLVPLGIRCFVSFMASRAANQRLKSLTDKDQPAARLMPESSYVVVLDEQEIVCNRPDGTQERIAWDNLQKVEILTTEDGPFAPDRFWVLHGKHSGCVIPQGATGDAKLLAQLQTLPGFDNGAVIEAMGSTSNATFVCWASPSPAIS
ncbi:MAG: hypothetical protein V4599_11585 [Verrucomicrobiota bacterium]